MYFRCEELQLENSNLKALVEGAGELAVSISLRRNLLNLAVCLISLNDFQEENEILEVEVASMRDVCDGLEADIEKLKDENDRTSKKYKKRREKLKKLLILKGISEWNSSDDDSD